MNPASLPITTDISSKRIVVINTAFLGDLVLTIPFLTILKKKFPKAHVSLICKKGIGELFLKLGLVAETFEVQKGTANDYAQVARKLNQFENDMVFCIHRSVRSFLFSLRIKTKLRVGYRLGFNFFGYKKKIKRDLDLPEPLRVIQLLTLVDESFADFFSIQIAAPDFNGKDGDSHLVAVPDWARFPVVGVEKTQIDVRPEFLDVLVPVPSGSKRIAVFPGSVWNTKRWPVESFALLIDRLSEMNYSILLMGGPGEEIFGTQIEKMLRPTTNITNLIGKSSVWESTVLLSHCDMVVANDSASAHIAALLAKKILVFFGPTVLRFGYRPWGNSVYVLENTQLSCRPCGAHGPNVCPIGTHVCMKSISADSAFKKIESVIHHTQH